MFNHTTLTRTRRAMTVAALAAVAGGVSAGVADAHTSAVCLVSGGSVRCVGTIADHLVAPNDNPASLAIEGGNAKLSLSAWPLLSIFAREIDVTAPLDCSQTLGTATCKGNGIVEDQAVAITTTGAADGSGAVVMLADGTESVAPEQLTAPSADVPHHATQTRHRRHRHHGRRTRAH
jgi:hypothetical protein